MIVKLNQHDCRGFSTKSEHYYLHEWGFTATVVLNLITFIQMHIVPNKPPTECKITYSDYRYVILKKLPPHPSVFCCSLTLWAHITILCREIMNAMIAALFLSPQAHVFSAEELLSRRSAVIPEDEKLLLALLHWLRTFPVIATSMHRKATACGEENAGRSHAELSKRHRAGWLWWMTDISLARTYFSPWDLSDRKKTFQPWEHCSVPDRGRCEGRARFFEDRHTKHRYTQPTRADAMSEVFFLSLWDPP